MLSDITGTDLEKKKLHSKNHHFTNVRTLCQRIDVSISSGEKRRERSSVQRVVIDSHRLDNSNPKNTLHILKNIGHISNNDSYEVTVSSKILEVREHDNVIEYIVEANVTYKRSSPTFSEITSQSRIEQLEF